MTKVEVPRGLMLQVADVLNDCLEFNECNCDSGCTGKCLFAVCTKLDKRITELLKKRKADK